MVVSVLDWVTAPMALAVCLGIAYLGLACALVHGANDVDRRNLRGQRDRDIARLERELGISDDA